MPGERFPVRLVSEDTGAADRVTVEVGLEGFNVLSSDGSRVLRKYPLHHISRWSMRGTSLILYTKSQVDVEDRTVTFQGDENTIRSVLDTLTCSCMQMAELLQSGQGPEGQGKAAAQSLNMLLKKSKKPALLTADQVEFWHHPEKAGWMHSQGEHIKTWRKRWFVLKQGFLFRFASSDVSSASKPRGIVDLSQVTDVSDGGSTTGRPNSIKVSTAGGHICYLTDSETAQVEWISALEGAVARIVKLIAGVDEEEAPRGGGGGASSSGAGGSSRVPKSWAEQLERSFASTGGGSGSASASRRTSSSNDRNLMVSVIGYGSSGGGGGGASAAPSRPAQRIQSGGGGGGGAYDDYGYVKVDYGGIAGAQSLPDRGGPSSYGGREPAPPSSSYGGVGGGSSYGAGASGSSYGGYQPIYQPQPSSYQPAPAAQYQPEPRAYQQQPQHAQQPVSHPMPTEMPPITSYGSYGQQQQPAAPGGYGASTLLDSVTAPKPPPSQPPSANPWQTHYTADGRAYYHNTATGITQWDPPNTY